MTSDTLARIMARHQLARRDVLAVPQTVAPGSEGGKTKASDGSMKDRSPYAEKVCRVCHQLKPFDDFDVAGARAAHLGLRATRRAECKSCRLHLKRKHKQDGVTSQRRPTPSAQMSHATSPRARKKAREGIKKVSG